MKPRMYMRGFAGIIVMNALLAGYFAFAAYFSGSFLKSAMQSGVM